jgi:hypothetical protein
MPIAPSGCHDFAVVQWKVKANYVAGAIMSARRALAEVFDVAIVGAGIIGLSCARAAALKGLRVVVLDRDAQANGASVRNFGFVTITGQERGAAWNRARRTAEVWRDVAAQAGIDILQRGLWMTARREQAVPLFEAFMRTEMADGCKLLSAEAARAIAPHMCPADVSAVLTSAHDLRVESREAIPKVAAWLSARLGVQFLYQTTVLSAEAPRIDTSRGIVEAGAVVVCPGDDLVSLFPEQIRRYAVTRCKLQMMRLASPGFDLPGAIMSDLGLVRYAGYAALPEAQPLRERLELEQAEHLRHGIHLIVTQSADGSLVVGDSHHYAATPDPFASDRVDQLILEEYAAAIGRPPPAVVARWTGTYSSAVDRTMFIDAPAANLRIVMVTSGSGASTGFAIGEEVMAGLFG